MLANDGLKCRLCSGKNINFKFKITSFSQPFNIYECSDCGFQFREIDEKEAYKFYDKDYYTGKAEYNYIDERKNEKASEIVWNARIRNIVRADKTLGEKNFLDVGCSFGGLMKVAEKYGYKSYGIEISEYSGNYALSRFPGRVFIGNVENINLPKKFFSAITMIEVIEHLYNPRKAVKNLYNSLKENGILLIQTADIHGLQAIINKEKYHYYLPGHLSYFDKDNLVKLLKETGFSKVRYIGGVEFGLLPKLLKSAYNFHKLTDYFSWIRISWYHLLSKITIGKLHFTSSMVIIGQK